jgi:hypothetical protein
MAPAMIAPAVAGGNALREAVSGLLMASDQERDCRVKVREPFAGGPLSDEPSNKPRRDTGPD